MPLSRPPRSRKLLHARTVQCYGYQREDGLWDIEGHMTDIKTYSFPNQDRGGEVKAGEPLHEMWIRLTLDSDLRIHDAEACTDGSPFNVCPEITGRYKQLIGLYIKPGWNLKIKQLFNGVEGCTHLTELLGPVATTAFQTIHPRRRGEKKPKVGDDEQPRLLNSCHAMRSDGMVIKNHWPKFYTGPDKAANE
ncbi:MAG: DUF2889 domain-containing protein [Candidatus Competibacteraceae bacterium]